MPVPYVYNGVVEAWHDGDTGTVALDLGFNLTARWSVRLVGMNARELAMPGGAEARDHLNGLCPVGTQVKVTSVNWDKFGNRIDADVSIEGVGSMSALMVRDGYAVRWNGVGPKPVPPWPIPAS